MNSCSAGADGDTCEAPSTRCWGSVLVSGQRHIVILLNSAPEGPRSRQNPRPINPQTLQTDPIRLSSHKGEVLRRANMWGNRTKRDKPLDLICSDDAIFAFGASAATQKGLAVIFGCWLRFVQPGFSRAHAGRISGSYQLRFWGHSLPQIFPELCRQRACHGTKRAARLYRSLGPAWLR